MARFAGTEWMPASNSATVGPTPAPVAMPVSLTRARRNLTTSPSDRPVLMAKLVTTPLVGDFAGNGLPACTMKPTQVQGRGTKLQVPGIAGGRVRSLPTVIEACA